MATKARPVSPSFPDRRHKPVGVTALVASRLLSVSEIRHVSRVLAAEGFSDLRATRIQLSDDEVKAASMPDSGSTSATILPERPLPPQTTLATSLEAARARGSAVMETLLADPEMLNTADMAERLGMSAEGVRQKRKRLELLGLEFAKRGIRYPAWQVLPDRQLIPGLPRLFAVLGDDPWRMSRFLQQRHGELGGDRALDALRHGRVDAVLAVAENVALGAFA